MFGLEYAVDTLSNALGNKMGTVWLVEQSALIDAPAGQHMMMRRLLQPKVQHVENETGCMPNFLSSTLQIQVGYRGVRTGIVLSFTLHNGARGCLNNWVQTFYVESTHRPHSRQ